MSMGTEGKRIVLGPLKLSISKRGIAYIWGNGKVHRLPFGSAGKDGDVQQGDQSEAQHGYDESVYNPDAYGDGYYVGDNQGEDQGDYYGGYDAEQVAYQDGAAIDGPADALFHNDLIMWAALILLPPLGVWILLNHRKKPDIAVRAAVSAASIVWFLVMLIWLFTRIFAGGGADTTTANTANIGTTAPPMETVFTPDTQTTSGGELDLTAGVQTLPADPQTNTPTITTGGSSGTGTASSGSTQPASIPADDPTVYATATGIQYHKTESCPIIQGTPSALLQSQALNNRLTACTTCYGNTDAASADASNMVWATKNGSYYHSFSTCSKMKNATKITIAQATAEKKKACPTCMRTYYFTTTGKYVHIKANCSSMLNPRKATYEQARATKKPACPVCIKKTATSLKAAEAAANANKTGTGKVVTYYASKGGKYYHTKSTCSGMKNATKISLANATKNKLTACPVCVARTSTGGTTYYSAVGGKYYHVKSNCSGMKGATKVTLATAKKRGQKPCPTCIQQLQSASTSDSKAVYYATKAGKYYHTKANCSGMVGAKKITLATALGNSKKPCPTCFKTVGTTTTTVTTSTGTNTYVYATTGGVYYHSRSACSGMTGARRVTLAGAIRAGKKACPVCVKRTYYYATSSNRYYHRTANCSGMKNATRITLTSAKSKGKIACPVCVLKKASSADLKVGTYIVKGGKYYHKNRTCNGMKGARKVSLAYAKGSGRTACPRCVLRKESTTANADKKVACYLLKRGTYYHATKNCSLIKGRSGIVKTSVYTAKKHSFKSCPECVSQKLKTYVYATPTGLYYHKNATCGNVKNTLKLSLQTAINRAYKRCTRCNPPAAK